VKLITNGKFAIYILATSNSWWQTMEYY